ncbi:MAG: glycosyltransferase family 4 protein [Hyphomicrobiaceae bacterium]
MRVLVATDAWRPQVNGVVRTYERLDEEVRKLGVELAIVSPAEFRSIPCPTYPEIRLAVPGYQYLIERVACIRPDAVHIATEGPVGWMMRAYCIGRRIPFTTSFHTRFPDYLRSRFFIPVDWTFAAQRRFHNASAGMMVASKSLADELGARGFQKIMPWTRGVDTNLFRPRGERLFGDGPIFIYVGRVAIEKNIEAFLKLDLPGRKVVVGAGPMLDVLRSRYPDVTFLGKLVGEDLARAYASADVFCFPSKTDTFGIVLLEAMASGVPIAAYPVTGPIDIVRQGVSGVLDEDLRTACLGALACARSAVRNEAVTFSWESAGRMFLSNIETALFASQGRAVPARRRGLAQRRRQTTATTG